MKNWRAHFLLLPVLIPLFLAIGCKSTYYSTWEKFGVYKRDLLKKRVTEARDEQKAAGAQFKDAMTRLKELYGFDGGRLEKAYSTLQKDFDRCAEKAGAVQKRIRDVESVAQDLFAEWEKEIKQIATPALADSSRTQLRDTRARYDQMHDALRRAEQSMEPVLVKFRDHVLYLKHNLNAQAIASLKGEATNIQAEISRLIADMNSSIARADEFIKAMP